MYLALFLTPWLLMYAISSLIFNHYRFVQHRIYDGALNQFVHEKEMSYEASFSDDMSPRQIGEHILRDLDLEGSCFVRGNLNEEKITINRNDPLQPRRISYFPKEDRLVIEKNEPTAASFLIQMHTRHGYGQDHLASDLFGLSVELVVITMVFWVASGLWMWWEIKPARKLGAVFALIGVTLFVIFFFTT